MIIFFHKKSCSPSTVLLRSKERKKKKERKKHTHTREELDFQNRKKVTVKLLENLILSFYLSFCLFSDCSS